MIRNYFIVACRTLWRNKIFSFINILGLSIGVSAALVIYLVVHYDFSFDSFEKDRDRIYRVVTDMQFSGNPFLISGVPSPLAEAVKNEMTGIEEIVAFHQFNGEATITISKGDAEKPTVFKKQPKIIFTDEHYFNLVGYEWLAGSPKEALTDPFKVVLTEQRAKLYFSLLDITDMVGKQVTYNDSVNTTVSGIIAFIIATPLAWGLIYNWLQNFAYRTPVSWWLFALSGVLMAAFAVITLSIETIRAASANPVKSLRTE